MHKVKRYCWQCSLFPEAQKAPPGNGSPCARLDDNIMWCIRHKNGTFMPLGGRHPQNQITDNKTNIDSLQVK